MSKTSAQAIASKAPGLTRSSATLLARQHTLGPHVCVQREATGPAVHPAAPSLVRGVVESPGSPLDAATRADMEPRFGYDFSQVRVHSDDQAAESARAVSANAYTAGNHVAFGADQYTPGTPSGQRLMAHELTHVVQQATGTVAGTPIGGGFHLSHPSDHFERNAIAESSCVDRSHDVSGNRGDAFPVPVQKQTGATYVQRQTPSSQPSLGLTTGQGDVVKGANKAAALSSWSALGSAIGGLASGVAALVGLKYASRQADAGERQADSNEDPTVAQPVEGGAKSNNPQPVPPAKASEKKSPQTETVEVINTTAEEIKAGRINKGDTQSVKKTTKPDGEKVIETTTKRKGGNLQMETTVIPKAESDGSETAKSIDLLQIQEGEKNIARYKLNLIADGSEIKGGSIRDGDIEGYTGGSVASNVSVTFQAKEAFPVVRKDTKSIAAVLIQFGGYNTPRRMELRNDKKPVKTANNPQRFTGTVKFDATGALVGTPVTSVNPSGTDAPVIYGTGAAKSPAVFIGLNTKSASISTKKEEGDPF